MTRQVVYSLAANFHGLGIDPVKKMVRFRITGSAVLSDYTRPAGLELALYLNGIWFSTNKTDKFGVVVFDLKVPFDKLLMEPKHTRNDFAIRAAESAVEGTGHFFCQSNYHPSLPMD